MNWLNKKEIAEFLGVSWTTIDRWRKDGLPCFKKGREIMFKKDEVIKWIESNRG